MPGVYRTASCEAVVGLQTIQPSETVYISFADRNNEVRLAFASSVLAFLNRLTFGSHPALEPEDRAFGLRRVHSS